MGFCRRCGEIVSVQAARCRCGGSAVAPTVNWNQTSQRDGGSPDRWAKTYVSTPLSCSDAKQLASPEKIEHRIEHHIEVNQSPTKPSRRFPRPLSSMGPPSLPMSDSRISHHIATTTARRTPSPSKSITMLSLTGSPGSASADVIASPDNATLTKAYGSILQRPETLPIHTCAKCASIFPPDATIYPDPQAPPGTATRFLCRPCFAANGGSKGDCASCGRQVLTVTKEGGFIESAGKIWHTRCFRCESCHKDIAHAPLVDLYGKPSCSECFESCVDRKTTLKNTPKKKMETANNLGGLRGGSRESSPALEELTERLGIKRQATPETSRSVSREQNTSPSPMRVFPGSRDDDSLYLRGSMRSGTPPRQAKSSGLLRNSPLAVRSLNTSSVIEPPTPALSSSSSFSESVSSSTPSTPSNSPRPSLTPGSRDSLTPKAKGGLSPLRIVTTGEPKCSRCLLPLFTTSGNGQIVTVPADSATGSAASYHGSCFRCFVCGDIFESIGGHAAFVKDSRGISHPECIRANSRIQVASQGSPSHSAIPFESIPEQPPKSAPPSVRPFPRFGGCESCPGCRRPVSLMEYGVVPGPQNTRWHVSCLVCGGKGARLPRPGCGKKLDSAAKTDHDGNVWCRECMLLLPAGTCSFPQGSPTRGALTPSYTGADRFPRPEAGRLFGQVTGNSFRTTDVLARQYTGAGAGIMRRGSVSPTRQLTRSVSPTKGLMPVTRHPRPVGSWRHKSIDEGRGMFLVKQMTGNGQT